MSEEKFIDAATLSLGEWLELKRHPPEDTIFRVNSFPTDSHLDEYLATIHTRSDAEVKWLLVSFLVHSGTYEPWDTWAYEDLKFAYKYNREMYDRMFSHTYYWRVVLNRRKNNQIRPWEGVTWVVDLLPHFPKAALEGLNAYLMAHVPILPDGLLQGILDALAVIRAKYIGLPGTQKEKVASLQELSPRQFENLAERLYHAMGYETALSQPSRDGGRDITAVIDEGARKELLLIQCKRYKGNVPVNLVRELYGVVSHEKANRGVLITSGRFMRPAREFAKANNIQLIDGDAFVMLLNENAGTNWPQKLDRLIAESEKHYHETHLPQQKPMQSSAQNERESMA